jgi:aminocarboxymuconate-semialdehyde decarboxylase
VSPAVPSPVTSPVVDTHAHLLVGARLVAGDVLDEGVRVLAAHGGGFFPYGTARQDHAWYARPGDRAAPRPPSRALRHLVAVAGADRVVLGTDYPFDMGVTDPLERLAAAGLDPAEAQMVRSGSAAALLAPAGTRV